MPNAAAFTVRTGRVATFNEHGGAGTVTDEDGGASWFFQCTRISGDERSIPVGAAVTYRVAPGPTGLEATEVSLR